MLSKSLILQTSIFLLWACILNIPSLVHASTHGLLYLTVNYDNPHNRLADGNHCDNTDSNCDVLFDITVRQVNSGANLIFVHSQLRPTEMLNELTLKVALDKPLGKWIEINIMIKDEDAFSRAEDVIGNFTSETINLRPRIGEDSVEEVVWKEENCYPQTKFSIKRITLACNQHFYSWHCSNECPENPTRYSCDENGQKICKPAYVGKDCDSVNYCEMPSYKCAEHSICRNVAELDHPSPSYNHMVRICTCNGDVEAPECYKDHDPCRLKPCKNFGQCAPYGRYNESYRCKCPALYHGDNCELRNNPCLQEAKRVFRLENNLGNKNDEDIELPLDFSELPCSRRGICLENLHLNKWECKCTGMFSGQSCESISALHVSLVAITLVTVVLFVMLFIILIVPTARQSLFKSSQSKIAMSTMKTYSDRAGNQQLPSLPIPEIMYSRNSFLNANHPPKLEDESAYLEPEYSQLLN